MLAPEDARCHRIMGLAHLYLGEHGAAESYFNDGSIAQAVPPLQALLHIMRGDNWQGHTIADPQVRALFQREQMLKSDWYRARLDAQQRRDTAHWEKRARYLEEFLARPNYADIASKFGIREKLSTAKSAAATARASGYLASLVGTLGVDPALVPL